MRKEKHPVTGSIQTMIAPPVKKQKKLMVETKEFGLGFILPHEPKAHVKQHQTVKERVIVHLVKANLEPRLMNGKPKKVLLSESSFTIITPPEEKKEPKVKREKGEKVPSVKDFTKYKFGGKELSKGKLVLELVRKFVADNNPTIIELKRAFPENEVKAYGKGLFVTLDEANKINTESKRTRFFTKKEEIIKIKGNAKIAVTNQVDAGLVKRLLPIAAKMRYTVREIKSTEVQPTAAE